MTRLEQLYRILNATDCGLGVTMPIGVGIRIVVRKLGYKDAKMEKK